ncbi:hypothetical protein SAMN04488005_0692 [Yoonia tamlensis]|uniref:Uncharacterized protein n=1 Tax=Yoonia tamlensis TaxID=390270 RepID=A0A1I6FXN3_9RHOB|nr:hypothetical protein [Yoonia tamlensis]SFR34688.1 hypothetical protein SAMN04488005_0692 [Yoonia tamlensis]
MKHRRLRVSLRNIKQHEFRTTLRYINASDANWRDVYTQLGTLQDDATKKLTKTGAGIFVYYLLMSSLGNEEYVSLTFQGVTASVPTAFVTVVASLGLFLIAMQAQTVLMLIVLRVHEGRRLSLRGFSMGMYGLYTGQDEMELATPVIGYGSFKEKYPISNTLSAISGIVFIAIAFPAVALWIYLLDSQWIIISSPSVLALYKVSAAFGIFVLISTLVYLVLFNLPLPISKNKEFVRWSFLANLHPVGCHPQDKAWREDE